LLSLTSELKWKPPHNLRSALEAMIDWFLKNEPWWEPLLEPTGRALRPLISAN
jgi:dTDP-D-glucose 4,6-dehydratase